MTLEAKLQLITNWIHSCRKYGLSLHVSNNEIPQLAVAYTEFLQEFDQEIINYAVNKSLEMDIDKIPPATRLKKICLEYKQSILEEKRYFLPRIEQNNPAAITFKEWKKKKDNNYNKARKK